MTSAATATAAAAAHTTVAKDHHQTGKNASKGQSSDASSAPAGQPRANGFNKQSSTTGKQYLTARSGAHQSPHREKLDQIESEITHVRSKIADIEAKIMAAQGSTGSAQDGKTGDSANQSIFTQAKAKRAALQEAFAQSTKINAELKTLREDSDRKGRDIGNIRDLDKSIAALETSLDSGRLTLLEERKALNELGRMQKLKAPAAAMTSALENNAKRIAQLMTEKETVQREITKLKAECDLISGAVKAAEETRNTQRDANQALWNVRKELSAKLNELFAKKKETYAAHHAWQESQKQARERAFLKRQQESQRRGIEEEIVELEDQLAVLDVNAGSAACDPAVDAINVLIGYVSEQAGVSSDASSSSHHTTEHSSQHQQHAENHTPACPSVLPSMPNMVLLKKPEADAFPLAKGGKKSHAQQSSSAANSKSAKHSGHKAQPTVPFHILSALAAHGITVPTDQQQWKQALTQLESQKTRLIAAAPERMAKQAAKKQAILDKIEAARQRIKDLDNIKPSSSEEEQSVTEQA